MANGIIYVVRLMNETDGNSKPCSRCQSYLHRHNVKKMKFTDIINGVNVLCEMKINM